MLAADWIGDLDAADACATVSEWHSLRMRVESELFFLAAHWADLHSGDALLEQRRRRGIQARPGMERAKRIGAHGTPTIAEFATAEFGALQGMGHAAADHLIRDALNVRHRHPRLWAALAAGEGRVWQARQVAHLCATAGLDADQAGWVDSETTEYLGALPWARFERLVETKIVEADPAAAEARRRAAAMRRFVATGQSCEYGLKTLVARANAGDVIFFVAMVDRIAKILALHGDTDSVDVRRSKAIGILATPARALQLLQSVTPTGSDPNDEAEGDKSGDGGEAEDGAAAKGGADATDGSEGAAAVDGDDGGAGETTADARRGDGDAGQSDDPPVISESDVHPAQNDADDPDPEPRPCPTCSGAGQVTGDPSAFVKPPAVDPRKLLPDATLYFHLDEAGLTRDSEGIAEFEGVGPITRSQMIEFLGHTNVRVVPVVDPANQDPVDDYTVPASMAEALHLRNPFCVSPWATNRSRKKDKDHNKPYVPLTDGGPPGQTNMDNLALLTRFPHRLKTHGRWRLRQTSPGVYEWRSPHGYLFRVDETGTYPLGRDRPGRDQRQHE